MKKETLNGSKIPYDYSISNLEKMIITGNMQTFTVCCEALSINPSVEAFNLLKSYLNSSDIYKRRFVLEVIFNHPMYLYAISELENALLDDNLIIIRAALQIIVEKRIAVAKENVFTALEQKGYDIDAYFFQSLGNIADKENEADYKRCLNMYRLYKSNASKQAVLALICKNIVPDKNWVLLFDEFKDDKNDKVRMTACELASYYKDIERLKSFSNDTNGHIRKYVAKNI